ncbi:MAG: potassium-transporting ATPase subunit C [Comamonadaceae bacterium]|nr:MAG: potassium-transporting ATPase subunit C [Comamonadaceae bacterium]
MLKDFTTALRPAIVMTILFAALLGLAYPAALTGIGQTVFPAQANGSLIREGRTVIGSELIGQAFASPLYFHGRPSAAGTNSSASAFSGSCASVAMSCPAKVTDSASGLSRLPRHTGHTVPTMYWATRFFISALWLWAKVWST